VPRLRDTFIVTVMVSLLQSVFWYCYRSEFGIRMYMRMCMVSVCAICCLRVVGVVLACERLRVVACALLLLLCLQLALVVVVVMESVS